MTYSSSVAVGRQRYAARNHNSVSFKASAKALGPVSNTIILIVLACLLGLLYLSQVTKTNAFGYQINDLQQQQASLQSEHSNLQLASARLQSLQRVQSSAQAKTMVAISPSGTVSN